MKCECGCNKELSQATCRKHMKEQTSVIIRKIFGLHWTCQEFNPEKLQQKEYKAIKDRLLDMRSGKEMADMCGCSQSKIASWLQSHTSQDEEKTWEQWGEFHGNACYRFSAPAVIIFLAEQGEKIEEEKKAKNKWNYQQKVAMQNAFSECTFFCEKCGEEIEAMPDSTAVRAYRDENLSLEEAKKLLLNAHIRHEHSNYDEIISEKSEKVANMKNISYETRQELFQEAKIEARRQIQ